MFVSDNIFIKEEKENIVISKFFFSSAVVSKRILRMKKIIRKRKVKKSFYLKKTLTFLSYLGNVLQNFFNSANVLQNVTLIGTFFKVKRTNVIQCNGFFFILSF